MRSFFDKPKVQIDGLFDAVDGAGIGILPVLVRIVKNGRFVVVRDPEGVIREAAEVVVDVAGVLVEVNARGIGRALDDGAEGVGNGGQQRAADVVGTRGIRVGVFPVDDDRQVKRPAVEQLEQVFGFVLGFGR